MPETDDDRRDRLNQINAEPGDGEPIDEADHFLSCPTCGQAFDMRRLGDVFHHNRPGHEPIPAQS